MIKWSGLKQPQPPLGGVCFFSWSNWIILPQIGVKIQTSLKPPPHPVLSCSVSVHGALIFGGTMIIAPFFGALRTPRNEEGATFAIHFRAVWQPQMHNPNVIPLGWWLELRKAWSRCQCTTGTCISVAPSFRHITWLYCFATTTAAIHEAITHGTNLSREPV